jgi:hypothetical protein
MRLLSRQRVLDKFDLYFLAATSDTPPSPNDLDAIENREWLWKRRYTTLELQHPLQGNPQFQLSPDDELGFRGLAIRSDRFKDLTRVFPSAVQIDCHPVSKIRNIKLLKCFPLPSILFQIYKEPALSFTDPDGAPILVFDEQT